MISSAVLLGSFIISDVAVPPCGRVLYNSKANLVSAYTYLPWNETLELLEEVEYNKSVTSIISSKGGCSMHIANDTYSDDYTECLDLIGQLAEHGICMEGMLHVPDADQMKRLGQNDTLLSLAVDGVAHTVTKAGLSGVSFDWEKKGEDDASEKGYYALGSALSKKLNPLGVRTSAYSNPWFHDIKHIGDSAKHFNLVNVDLYKSSSWDEHFKKALNSGAALQNLQPTCSCHTDKGKGNCDENQIANRFQKILNATITNACVFSMSKGDNLEEGRSGCFTNYKDAMQNFRAQGPAF